MALELTVFFSTDLAVGFLIELDVSAGGVWLSADASNAIRRVYPNLTWLLGKAMFVQQRMTGRI